MTRAGKSGAGMKALFVRLLLAFVLSTTTALAVGVDEKTLSDPVQEAAARDIMKDLRCLVCQNQSIEDSDADLARDLRALVRERIAAGDSPDQVKSYLVQRYGEWVLLRPPFSTRTAVLWLGPGLVLVVAILILWRTRRRIRRSGPQPLTPEEEARLRVLLDRRENRP